MNKIYLSGIVADPPMWISQENVKHVTFPLCVSHKTRQGLVKRELYNIQTWNGVAEWAHDNLKQGQRVMLQGYLTQRGVRQGDGGARIVVEVTAEEMFPASMPRPVTVVQTKAISAEEASERAAGQDREARPEAAS